MIFYVYPNEKKYCVTLCELSKTKLEHIIFHYLKDIQIIHILS